MSGSPPRQTGGCPAPRNRWRTVLDACLTLAFAALFIDQGRRLAAAFPASYTWSELLIRYEGGFIRRGLLGELAFRLDALVPTRDLLTAAVVAASCGGAAWFVVLTRRTRPLAASTFLLSPAGLLFPAHDAEVFGRKDAFIVAALALSGVLVLRAPRRLAFAGLLLTYAVAGLVVETAWLYLPLAVALYATQRGRDAPVRWHIAVWGVAGGVLALCCLATAAANLGLQDIDVAQARQDAIARSWQALYPLAYPGREALTWLGMSPREGVVMALREQGHRSTLLGYALAFALAQVPLVLFVLDSSPMPAPFRRTAAAVGFTAMAASFAFGADWGRYIQLWTLHAFAYAVLTRSPHAAPPVTRRDRAGLTAAVVLVALYASTWRLRHYAWSGQSAFVPGAVFRMVRTTD